MKNMLSLVFLVIEMTQITILKIESLIKLEVLLAGNSALRIIIAKNNMILSTLDVNHTPMISI